MDPEGDSPDPVPVQVTTFVVLKKKREEDTEQNKKKNAFGNL